MASADKLKAEFQSWIDVLVRRKGILFYRDQNADALMELARIAQTFQPTRIVEIGTLHGMSLRTWIRACPAAHVTAIDLSFEPLTESQSDIPCPLERVSLLQQNVMSVDFSRLWSDTDRVLLFIDAHDLLGMPIMEFMLRHAIPHLPNQNVVVVDDLWHTPNRLDPASAKVFLAELSRTGIDMLQVFDGHYAPYWNGGSFLGFPETHALLRWVNLNHIPLNFSPNSKMVYFEHHKDRPM